MLSVEVIEMADMDIPIGFSMAIAQNEDALNAFASMDAGARARVLDRARRASSREDMQRVVESLTRPV